MKQLTPEQSTKLAKELKLKPKTKAFVDLTLQDPKISNTEAYLRTHKTDNRHVASVEASKTLAKPSVQIYKQTHIMQAVKKIVELTNHDKPDIALRASQDILDRTQGKATIQSDNNTYTQINISLGNDTNIPDTVDVQ